MKNKKLKGFTLVELLVVIAILAVLATVSVVGYTSFITKANNSNALTECKQAEDIVLSDLISAGKDLDAKKTVKVADGKTIEFEYSVGQGKVAMTFTGITGKTEIPKTALKDACRDLEELQGSFYADVKTVKDNDGNDVKDEEGNVVNVYVIYYLTSNDKGIAEWASGSSPATPSFDAETYLSKK